MEQNNGTEMTEFILLGFAGQPKYWHVLFTAFLVIYVATLVGNIGMILLIKTDSSLHTPMYFFLQNLAFVDLCYTSAITPKMLQNFVGTKKSISFMGCMVQLLVYGTFITSVTPMTFGFLRISLNSEGVSATPAAASQRKSSETCS